MVVNSVVFLGVIPLRLNSDTGNHPKERTEHSEQAEV
jgi:hypothetical protein